MSIEKFDCCSSFHSCSDAMACIHQDNPRYNNCTYRKKLEKGICFYGKNRNIDKQDIYITKVPVQERKKEHKKPKIYLACYKQLFSVFARRKEFSYKIDADDFNLLSEQFEIKNIPYRTSLDFLEDLPGNEVDITGPCNSRVVFKVLDKEFHILNFNSYLIHSYYAERISKSLIVNGFESRVELIGIYANGRSQVNSITKTIEQPSTKPAKIANIDVQPIQLTLLDLTEFVAPMRRR